jgi:hypothetical protein
VLALALALALAALACCALTAHFYEIAVKPHEIATL